MELQGYEIEIMRLEEWGVPDYYELILITINHFLKKTNQILKK
ncbi:MAG: hypothetical protein Ct9H90mP2_03390 [Dehalococcoidia bacterium]|nr:MAG: hypothetical protein Ct9H90mP2_03390 [Dehalococcoidia bacterium]